VDQNRTDYAAESQWGQRFGYQVFVLLKKNLRLLTRNRTSTACRLGACVLFMLLAKVLVLSLSAALENEKFVRAEPHPVETPILGIQKCGLGPDCLAFGYTPAPLDGFVPSAEELSESDLESTPARHQQALLRAHRVIRSVLANNARAPLDATQVQGFVSERSMDDYMMANLHKVEAGVILVSPTPTNTSFILQVNASKITTATGKIFALQLSLTKAIGELFVVPGRELTLDISLQPYAHPKTTENTAIQEKIFVSLFILMSCLFPFVIQMSEVVTDRETKMALTGFGYFLSAMVRTSFSTIVIGLGVSLVSLIMWVIVGFAGTPWGLWPHAGSTPIYLNCTAHALLKKSTVARMSVPEYWPTNSTGINPNDFLIQRQRCEDLQEDSYNWTTEIMRRPAGFQSLPVIFTLLPMGLLVQDLTTLGQMASNETGGYGLDMHNVSTYCQINMTTGVLCDQDYSVGASWGLLFSVYLFYSLLALWLDNVVPNAMGVYKVPWYFVLPSYWGWAADILHTQQECVVIEPSEDDDVIAAEQLVMSHGGLPLDDVTAIEIRGLAKTFRRGGKPYHAVKSPFFAIQKKSLFALLGPNGAGKTTMINMLTGVLNPSSGDALIATMGGTKSIIKPADMSLVRTVMGICPQHDILWERLSALEHLELFATLKGVPVSNVRQEADRLLEQVRLADVSDKQAGTFSGGMKRRLSVAIALIGNPQVVFLDEPTTGMDPISRRHVWDVIDGCKQHSAIVLTTHSMEEADILGDNIGIMAKGRLRCLGNAVHLKSKFGAGYRLTLTLSSGANRDEIKRIVKTAVEEDVLGEAEGQLTFMLKTSFEDRFAGLFSELENDQQALGISDIQLGMSSLEDVFLDVIQKAEAAEAQHVSVTLSSGETVTIQLGLKTPVAAPSGVLFLIKWGLDENGVMMAIDSHPVEQMNVTVPEGVCALQQVSIRTPQGIDMLVTVPEGMISGDTFVADVSQPRPPATGPPIVAQSEENSSSLSEIELEERVVKLSSSFASQGKAIFTKTWALQKKKCCHNICLCTCPTFALVLAFLIQWLLTVLVPDATSSQRCTYCGSDDAFGRLYCAGKPCQDFFFPLKNDDWMDCTSGEKGSMSDYFDEEMNDYFDEHTTVVGDRQGLTMAGWQNVILRMDQQSTLMTLAFFGQADSNSDSLVSREEWDRNVIPLMIGEVECRMGCLSCLERQRSRCVEISTWCGNNGNSSCFWPNAQGSKGESCGHLVKMPVGDGISNLMGTPLYTAYKEAKPLPFLYAPKPQVLSKRPVAFSAKDPAIARKLLDRVYPQPADQDRFDMSTRWLLDALWTILMMPKIGCGQMVLASGPRQSNVTDWTFETVGASANLALIFNSTVQSAMCKLFQQGEASPRSCCVDLSNKGLAAAQNTLETIFGVAFATAYMEQLSVYGSPNAMNVCAQPMYDSALAAKLNVLQLGMEAKLAVLAQHFSLPLDTVHPQLEARSIPECTDAGNCETPHGKWAFACEDVMSTQMYRGKEGGYTYEGSVDFQGQNALGNLSPFLPMYSEPKCSCRVERPDIASLLQEERAWCEQTSSDSCCMVREVLGANGRAMFDANASHSLFRGSTRCFEEEPAPQMPCLCVFQNILAEFVSKRFGSLDPNEDSSEKSSFEDEGNLKVTDLPRLAGIAKKQDIFSPFLPFGSFGASLGTAVLHAEALGAIYADEFVKESWIGIDQSATVSPQQESSWYRTWDRFAVCKCFKANIECSKFVGPGCDELARPWEDNACRYDDDCECENIRYEMNRSTPAKGWQIVAQQGHSISQGYDDDDDGQQAKGQQQMQDYCDPYSWNYGDDETDYNGFTLLIADCTGAAISGDIQMLKTLYNISKINFECVSMKHLFEAHDHSALDDVVFRAFGKSPQSENPDSHDTGSLVSAIDFKDTSQDTLHMTLMYNTSGRIEEFWGIPVEIRPRRDRTVTSLNLILRAFLAESAGLKTLDTALLLAIKDFPASPPWGDSLDLGSEFGPFLFTFTFLILFPGIVSTFVQEKVARIRIMMKMMGLGSGAFWIITYSFWFLIYFCFSMLFFLFSCTVQLPNGYTIGMFRNVDAGIQFVFYVLYSSATVSFAFLWGTVISNLRTAQVLSFLWVFILLVTCFTMDLAANVFNSDGVPEGLRTFITLWPPVACFRAFNIFRAFKDVTANPYTDDTFLSFGNMPEGLSTVLIILLVETPLWLLLAVYLDQVMDTGFGVQLHPLWFLGFDKEKVTTSQGLDAESVAGGAAKPEDVLHEESRVRALLGCTRIEQDCVMTNKLRKIYPPSAAGIPPKTAVQDLTLGIQRGECFGMLGPNGAGKTTSINMLIGLARPTQGDASIEGFSIVTHMHKIYSIMGVCPQHDILWETLTAREHLTFYGHLKNLHGADLRSAVADCLKAVNLLDVIDVRSCTFSGGMKRRLSVAISLIGSPLVCFLDEPSTGLDPASRRLLWKCIENATSSRAILLTTHSMEEAEVLCNRLGIFVDGQLCCIGKPADLTRRFGGIFILTVTATDSNLCDALSTRVEQVSNNVRITYALAGTLKFELPADQTKLSAVFATMVEARSQGLITSWGITSCTLEDAFIKISQTTAAVSSVRPTSRGRGSSVGGGGGDEKHDGAATAAAK